MLSGLNIQFKMGMDVYMVFSHSLLLGWMLEG